MTSGQGGGQYGAPGGGTGPEDQPGWNAPPPAPPAPPYGQPGPGYMPAPSAPTGWGAPRPLERPTTVQAGIGALVANLILGVIASIVVFSDIDSLLRTALAQSEVSNANISESAVRAGIVAGAVIGLIFVGLEALFLWFAWNGRNWARVVLWVIGGLAIVSGVAGLSTGSSPSGFLTALSVVQLLLAIAGVVLLALKPSNDWYRYRGWLRATGQGR